MVPALIVHGGAGGDPDDKPTYREALGEALTRGWAVLRRRRRARWTRSRPRSRPSRTTRV